MALVSFSLGRGLWAAVAVTVGVRLGLIIYAETTSRFAFGDGRLYVDLGRSLAAGQGLSISKDLFVLEAGRGAWAEALMARWRRAGLWDFILPGRPTAFVMPLYPCFVGGLFFLFGPRVLAVRLVQLIVAAAVPLLIYYVARNVFNRRAALAAAWLGALYPPFVFYAASVTNQLLSLVALLGVVAGYYLVKARATWGRVVLLGVTGGAAFLTRAELSGVAAMAVAAFVGDGLRHRRCVGGVVARGAAALGVGFVVALPWALRNYVSLGHFSFLPTQGPRVLWEANAHPLSAEFARGEVPAYRGLYEDLRREELRRLRRPDLAEMPTFTTENEFARARVLRARVMAFVKANPRVYGRLCLVRAGQFVRLEPLNFPHLVYRLSYATYGLLLLLGVVGLALSAAT